MNPERERHMTMGNDGERQGTAKKERAQVKASWQRRVVWESCRNSDSCSVVCSVPKVMGDTHTWPAGYCVSLGE